MDSQNLAEILLMWLHRHADVPQRFDYRSEQLRQTSIRKPSDLDVTEQILMLNIKKCTESFFLLLLA